MTSSQDFKRMQALTDMKTKLAEVDYVRFTICDIHGISRGKTVPSRSALSLLKKGMCQFIGIQNLSPRSALMHDILELECMRRLQNAGNLLMYPDLQTFRKVSWGCGSGQYKVAEVICNLRTMNYEPIFNCNRTQAQRQIARLEHLGFQLLSGIELEFMLLDKDSLAPLYSGVDLFSTITMSEHMDFFAALEQGLFKAGIPINDIHPEAAPGQFEINYEPTWGILGGDWPFVIKQAIKESASRAGLTANFMGRPFSNRKAPNYEAGNGAHFNHSLWDLSGENNLFHDKTRQDKVSDLCRHWVAGLVKNLDAMTALVCPTVNCYRRLDGPWAPSVEAWGIDDRYSTIRVKNYDKTATYVENRLPSGLVNPYLAVAATIAAGLDGVINKLEPPPQRQGGEKVKMPRTLEQSLEALENSTVMREALGEEFVHWFCALKREGEISVLSNFDPKSDDEQAFDKEMEMYGKFM